MGWTNQFLLAHFRIQTWLTPKYMAHSNICGSLQCVLPYSNMWILKRMSELGVSMGDQLMTYLSRVRVYIEQNVPLWHFSITKQLSNKIENIQKASFIHPSLKSPIGAGRTQKI